MNITDEMVDRAAEVIWDAGDWHPSLEWRDAKFYAKNPQNERVVLGVRRVLNMARAALEAALWHEDWSGADAPGYSDDAGNYPDSPGGY